MRCAGVRSATPLTRSPALDSNCCRLMEPLPFDICENSALVVRRLCRVAAGCLAQEIAELALADAAVAVRIDGGEQLFFGLRTGWRRCCCAARSRSCRWWRTAS